VSYGPELWRRHRSFYGIRGNLTLRPGTNRKANSKKAPSPARSTKSRRSLYLHNSKHRQCRGIAGFQQFQIYWKLCSAMHSRLCTSDLREEITIDAIANIVLVAHWHGTSGFENNICLTAQSFDSVQISNRPSTKPWTHVMTSINVSLYLHSG